MRRLWPLARANPMLAVLAAFALAGLLVGPVWYGVHNSAALVAAASTNEGLIVSIVATSLAVFAAVALTVQHMSAAGESLDAQVRSAPLTRLELFLGTVGLPATIFCLVLMTFSLGGFVPLIFGSGASWYALCTLVCLEAGVFYAAGVAGEVLVRITHRQFEVLLALPPIAAAWVGAGALSGDASWLGVVGAIGRSVVNLEVESTFGLVAGALLFLVVSVTDWIVLAAILRPPGKQSSSRVGYRWHFPSHKTGVVVFATLKQLGRERKLQRHVALVCVTTGLFSVLVAAFLPEIVALGVYGGTLLGALGVAVVPLTTPGVSQDSGWFWRSAPLTMVTYVIGLFVSGLLGGMIALLAPELAALSPLVWSKGSVSPSEVLRFLFPDVPVILLLAVGVGFLAPCRLHDTFERILSFALLGAVLAGVFAAASWASPRLGALGVPGPIAGTGFVLAVAVLGFTTALLAEYARRKS